MSTLRLYAPAIMCFLIAAEVAVFHTTGALSTSLRWVAFGGSVLVSLCERARRRRRRKRGDR